MPSKNVTKYYIQNGYYHIYNRGVEKRSIFQDAQDYNVFLNYLSEYLLPKDRVLLMSLISDDQTSASDKDQAAKLLRLNNFSDEIQMMAYCLQPNHFHFLIKQRKHTSIDRFMNSLGTRYTMYFNKKYDRVGRLYQDVYKAVEVDNDEYLLQLSKYIHKQALPSQPSSYLEYIGQKHSGWVHPQEVLSFFSGQNKNLTYEAFVNDEEDLDAISNLILEEV